MILLINTILKDHKTPKLYGLKYTDRMDVFKYSLASLNALNKHWSKIIICCKVNEPYKTRWDELEIFIGNLFKGLPIVIYKNLVKTKEDWLSLYASHIKMYSDNLIWFQDSCDQIFIDYDLTLIDGILQSMYGSNNNLISCIYSKWPEFLRICAQGRKFKKEYGVDFFSRRHQGTQIITKEILLRWAEKNYPNIRSLVPYRELARKFDGYGNTINIPKLCPPLTIPPGFFNNCLKIQYCGNSPTPGWVHVNPLIPYRTTKKGGADYHYCEEDIPLFWKDKINEFKVINEIPSYILHKARYKERMECYNPKIKVIGINNNKIVPLAWGKQWLKLSLINKPTISTARHNHLLTPSMVGK